MKTVTQYTALIRLTAQMREQESIPDQSEKEASKDSSGSFSDIDHMYGIYVSLRESVPFIPTGAI